MRLGGREPPRPPPAKPAPARELAACAGTYENPYFGRLTAVVHDERLELRLGSRRMPVLTRRWDGDTFAVAFPGYGEPQYTGLASFQFGQGDRAVELRFVRAFDDAAGGRFARVAD